MGATMGGLWGRLAGSPDKSEVKDTKDSSAKAERRLRSAIEKARKELFAQIRSLQEIYVYRRKIAKQIEDHMANFQKIVCFAVLEALESEDPCAAAFIKPHLEKVEWNLKTQSRRFSLRNKQEPAIEIVPANVATFSHILSYMRSDSTRSIRCSRKPFSRCCFSTFFFCIRSLFAAWAKQRLYVIHLLVPNLKSGAESLVVGFAQMDVQKDDAVNGTKRKRKRDTWSLWVDLFEVFAPFRRYGIGRRFVAALPSFTKDAFPFRFVSFIRLTPLEEAEPFWLNSGFSWSDPVNRDGHLLKPVPTHKPKRRRLK